jgi:hypothetical protein
MPEDYSPEEEVSKLHAKQKEEARERREQAERRTREKEEEALKRRENAERWMRGRRTHLQPRPALRTSCGRDP